MAHRFIKHIGVLFAFTISATLVLAAVPMVGSAANNSLVYATSLARDPDEMPAAKSVSLDAKELLFGKLGDTLTLKAAVKPVDADTSNIKYTTSNKKIATVGQDGKVKARRWGKCTVTVEVGGKKASCRVVVAKKWVAITFDDGPSKHTTKLLKAMKKRNINSTFFVVGAQANSKARQAILRRMSKDGNEIANHTYNHNGTAEVLLNQLKKTDTVIKKATGNKSTLMRPPGGGINDTTRVCGKPIIMWSVDPRDWESRNTSRVYKYIKKHTKSGSIVLLHDSHSTSVAAAIKLFKSLGKKGYAFVTVTQLLNNPKANKVYNSGSSKVRTQKIN